MIRDIISTLRIIFTVAFFLGCVSVNVANSDSLSKSEEVIKEINGYLWEQTPKEMQEFFLIGYITGSYMGYIAGYGKGAVDGNKIAHESLLKSIKNSKICEGSYSSIELQSAFSMLSTGLALGKKFDEIPDMRNIDFYKNEIIAFYQTYPLCKSQNFFIMLQDFSQIWDKNTETSYKEIGNKCLEKKKTK